MNPAARVLDLYDRFKALGRKQEANTQLQAIWAQVFDLQPEDKPEDDVPKFLSLLGDEIELARLLLVERTVPAELYDHGFKVFKNAASPAKVHNTRDHIWSPLLANDIRLHIAIGAWALRDLNESELPQAEKDQYQAYFKTLEAESANLPSAMRSIMRRQTEGALAALRVYRVRGAQPLREAIRAAVGEAVLNAPAVAVEMEHATPAEARTFADGVAVLNKVAEVSDNLFKTVIAAGKETELRLLAATHTARWSNLLPAPEQKAK